MDLLDSKMPQFREKFKALGQLDEIVREAGASGRHMSK
jgi:hypothetical protein